MASDESDLHGPARSAITSSNMYHDARRFDFAGPDLGISPAETAFTEIQKYRIIIEFLRFSLNSSYKYSKMNNLYTKLRVH